MDLGQREVPEREAHPVAKPGLDALDLPERAPRVRALVIAAARAACRPGSRPARRRRKGRRRRGKTSGTWWLSVAGRRSHTSMGGVRRGPWTTPTDHDPKHDVRDRRRQPGRRQGGRDATRGGLRRPRRAGRRRARAPVRASAAVQGVPARRGRARRRVRPGRASTPSTRSTCASARPSSTSMPTTASSRSTAASGSRYDRLLLATGAEPRRLTVPARSPRRPLPADAGRQRCAARAPRRRRPARRGRARAGSGPRSPRPRASAASRSPSIAPVVGAARARPRARGRRGLLATSIVDHGVEMLLGGGVASFEGDGRVERVRTRRPHDRLRRRRRGRGGDAAHGARRRGRPGGRERHPRRRAPARRASRGSSPRATSPTTSIPRSGRLRVEHWDNALHQGPAAARGMLGSDERLRRALPYFFSDQYDVGMEYSGYATSWDRVVFRGDPARREFIAFWLAGGRVLAGMNVNVWDVTEPIQALIASRPAIDERRLADPDVPLTDLPSLWTSRWRREPPAAAPRRGRVDLARHAVARPARERRSSRRCVDDSAVTGATSNPTIFAKAITGIGPLRRSAASRSPRPARTIARELFFAIALDDVRAAAAILRPVHERSRGSDGFISFECTPDVADDAEAHDRPGARPLAPPRPAQRPDQGARHAGGGRARSRS